MNAVLYNMVYCMIAMGALNFFDGLYNTNHKIVDASFALKDMDTFIEDRYYKEQIASFQFDLKADITDLFNWNTNIIFLSVVCEFETPDSKKNSVIVWDQRIPREQTQFYKLDLQDEWVEYYLTDLTKTMKGKKINVFLRWEQMTTIGPYYSGTHALGSFNMPEKFVNEGSRR